jgi:hypothetical protein
VLVFIGFGGLLLSLMLILGVFVLHPRSLSSQATAVIRR